MTNRTKLINRRYRLERRMTLTETTETWLGFDCVLHRAIAVTMPRQEILRDAPFLVEFLQRSRIATALHHRGIVAAFDSGEDGDTPYLVTEYVGGEHLTEIIRSEAPFDVDDVAILVEQVAGALDYAHQRGFVHGSLSPANVVVDGQGATKLLGLGIPAGSVSWQSGATRRDPLTFDDDVRALAAIAFEMLTGEEPNAVEPDSAGAAYLIDPDVPRNASDIVAIGLGASPIRFSSAGVFARSLSGWRTFDPGDHFVAPEPPFEFSDDLLVPVQDSQPGFTAFESEEWFYSDVPSSSDLIASVSSSNRSVRLALVAALLLALVAGIVVWRGSEASAGPSTVTSPQIELLAELSGF